MSERFMATDRGFATAREAKSVAAGHQWNRQVAAIYVLNRGIYDLWSFLRRSTLLSKMVRPFPLKDMTMKDSKTLLLDYLASIRDPERAASLFADDGAFELPFLRSLGVEPRYSGRREITALLHNLLELYPDFAFAEDDIHILIETPEKTFAEYVAHARAAATGRTAHHLFTGYLVAEAGEIKLLRETFNPLTMAQAQLRNGAADIGPPGDELHAF
jgi:hypothetical protein